MQPRNFTLAVIGAGNMGQALLAGVLRSGITSKERIVVSDIEPARLDKVVQSFGVRSASSNAKAVEEAQVILLAVKPQNLQAVAEQIGDELVGEQLLISILAGVPVSRLRSLLGPEVSVVRVMPNLPALIGQGMSVVAADAADPSQIELVRAILETVGEVVVLPEKHLDAVTALSGSGPGYVYLFVEALAEAGEAVGLPREAARQMARRTFIGACRLLETSSELPEELRRRVTSPGGTTEAGLKVFEELGLRDLFKAAIQRSTDRATELGRG